jgi:hypothetical protein
MELQARLVVNSKEGHKGVQTSHGFKILLIMLYLLTLPLFSVAFFKKDMAKKRHVAVKRALRAALREAGGIFKRDVLPAIRESGSQFIQKKLSGSGLRLAGMGRRRRRRRYRRVR